MSEDNAVWRDQKYMFEIDGSIVDPARVQFRYERVSGEIKERREGDRRLPTEIDKDRVLYSPYFKRLAGVSQVVSPTLRGRHSHTRLMHSLKVSNVAKEIANDLCRLARELAESRHAQKDESVVKMIAYYGGLDISTCEVAGLSHDIGHAPFGHAAERAIDQWIRQSDEHADGFEGNPQTVRILSRLDRRKISDATHALDLTKVSLRALLKYPWFRDHADDLKSRKFGVYETDREVLLATEESVARFLVDNELMSVEACIMDMADDITYAMHDLQDFYELGLIDFVRVERELLEAYEYVSREFLGVTAKFPDNEFSSMAIKLDAINNKFDREEYLAALVDIQTWIHDNPVLWERYDNSQVKSSTIRSLVSEKIKEILSGLRISASEDEALRHQVIHLEQPEWHRLQVLKGIAVHSVIASPAVALHEKSQVAALINVLNALEEICRARNIGSIPHPLQEFVRELDVDHRDGPPLRSAIADYVCGLTDESCVEISRYVLGVEVPEVGVSFL